MRASCSSASNSSDMFKQSVTTLGGTQKYCASKLSIEPSRLQGRLTRIRNGIDTEGRFSS